MKLTENELTAWRLFLKAHAEVIDRIERDLAEQKRVTLTSYDVLIALFEAPERKLRLNELTRKVVLTKSGLTRLLDRLEREALIRREKSEEDRRGIYAVLTAEGERQLRWAWPVYAAGIQKYFSNALSDAQIQMLTQALATIRNNLQLQRNEKKSYDRGFGL